VRGLGLDCLYCLGLRRVFAGEMRIAPWHCSRARLSGQQ
jgi:hypothetical protein